MPNVSPLLQKGAILSLDPTTGIPLGKIMLQYNPDTLTRSLQIQAVPGGADGVRVDAVAPEIAIECPAGTDGRQPQAEAKCADRKVSDVNEGIHACVVTYSIDGCFRTGIHGRMRQ